MSSNMDKDRYWEEWSAYEAHMDSQNMDLDAIVENILNNTDNSGKFKVKSKSYDDFESFWDEVKAFADQYQLSYAYTEEEFVIDGELHAVHLTFPDDPLV